VGFSFILGAPVSVCYCVSAYKTRRQTPAVRIFTSSTSKINTIDANRKTRHKIGNISFILYLSIPNNKEAKFLALFFFPSIPFKLAQPSWSTCSPLQVNSLGGTLQQPNCIVRIKLRLHHARPTAQSSHRSLAHTHPRPSPTTGPWPTRMKKIKNSMSLEKFELWF
jgi:hypothetical protein